MGQSEEPVAANAPGDGSAEQASSPSPEASLADSLRIAAVRLRRAAARKLGAFRRQPRWFDHRDGRLRFRLSLERGGLMLAALLFATGVAATLSSAFGLFRVFAPFAWLLWAATAFAFVVASLLRRICWEGDHADLAALVVALVAFLSAGALHHHYYAAQADIGFYVTDATATATTGSRVLTGPFDQLIPGFSATPEGARLSAMFGYSSLAAVMTWAFGMFATPWINAPLAFVTATALYAVGRQLSGRSGAILGVLFWLTSLITLWLTRWTMTENAATATFWVAALLALSLWERWDNARAALLGITLAYGALVRAEGAVILAWFALLLLVRFDRPLLHALQRLAHEPALRNARRATIVATLLLLLVLVPFGIAFYRTLPVDYLASSVQVAGQFLRGRPAADAFDVPTSGPGPNWGDYALRYEWESALAYYLPWFLLVGLLGVALRLVPWRRALVLLLLVLPYVVFIMIPPVTTAHPWFMRRLWVALVPLAYVLAGASLDFRRVAWRWPFRTNTSSEPRIRNVLFGSLVLLLLLGLNVGVSAPVALRRETDSVAESRDEILAFLPPGSAVIIDEDVVEYTSLVRFHHDGPVVPWFNRRAESFFASFRAADSTNQTVLLRVPASNRNFLDVGPAGAVRAELQNATLANPPRRDFRTYLASPPLEQGYNPLAKYLTDDVPPNDWRSQDRPYQLLEARTPLVLEKNIGFTDDWARTNLGLLGTAQPSRLTIDTTKFREEVLERFSLGVHFVYVQTLAEPVDVTAPDQTEPIGQLPMDGSGTTRAASIRLPSPMRLSSLELPQGVVLRGILLDLY